MDVRTRRAGIQETIRLDTDGNWFQGEYPILHERTIQFLYKNIVLNSEGRYYLTGEDKPVYFHAEDVAYWVIKSERTIAGFLITLTDGTIELLDLNTLWIGKQNALYCLVKGRRIPCKFFRAPYYEITKDLQKRQSKYSILFNGKRYAIHNGPPKQLLLLKKKRSQVQAMEKKKMEKRRRSKATRRKAHRSSTKRKTLSRRR